jgi:hypothetical protein
LPDKKHVAHLGQPVNNSFQPAGTTGEKLKTINRRDPNSPCRALAMSCSLKKL